MNTAIIVELFARSGGGGSSSGGDGGGGGGIIIIFGYIPMHFIGAKLKKHLPVVTASAVAWPIAIIYSVILILIFKFIGFLMAIGAILGTGAGLYGWFDKLLKLRKKAKKDLAVAAMSDSSWNEAELKDHAQNIFFKYQQDWSNNNIEPARLYMTPEYFHHAQLMVMAVKQSFRQNSVVDPQIKEVQLIQVDDAVGKTGDSYTVAITAQADDQLFDTRSETLLFEDVEQFTEFWRFERSNNQWLLAGIRQSTEDKSKRSKSLEQFAQAQKFFYSPDWGWLLLPKRGQLFGRANFGKSDINNHVIGTYHKVLVQIYNYQPVKTSNEKTVNYLVAQVSVPKEYGNILVRKKRSRFTNIFSKPKGLTRLRTEWADFNNKYEVWASDLERATSFELLHPAFMAELHDLPFIVNIEVVDNVVYLYGTNVNLTAENYLAMLGILHEAFAQMKM